MPPQVTPVTRAMKRQGTARQGDSPLPRGESPTCTTVSRYRRERINVWGPCVVGRKVGLGNILGNHQR